MEIRINNKKIGDKNPIFIIAEACDNHLGSMELAKQMAKSAKEAGADAVKFQHHLPDEEMLPDLPMSNNFAKDESLYIFLKKYALSITQHAELKSYCEDEVGIIYMCTPFSYQAAKELNELNISAFKIGSGEMTDLHSLCRIAAFGKPMIISTGMSNWEEIDRTYKSLLNEGASLALMNCVSEYPPVYKDLNLDVLTLMQKKYTKAIIGHSDHTPDLYTCFAAATLNAQIIEKHVIIDKNQLGPDRDVSISFDEMTELVEGIRKIEDARGNERQVHENEQAIRTWAFRFVVTRIPLKKGMKISKDLIEEDQLTTKRTGMPDGIPSHQMKELENRILLKDKASNAPLFWSDFE